MTSMAFSFTLKMAWFSSFSLNRPPLRKSSSCLLTTPAGEEGGRGHTAAGTHRTGEGTGLLTVVAAARRKGEGKGQVREAVHDVHQRLQHSVHVFRVVVVTILDKQREHLQHSSQEVISVLVPGNHTLCTETNIWES